MQSRIARTEGCRRLKLAQDSDMQLTQDLRPGLRLFRPSGSILQDDCLNTLIRVTTHTLRLNGYFLE